MIQTGKKTVHSSENALLSSEENDQTALKWQEDNSDSNKHLLQSR